MAQAFNLVPQTEIHDVRLWAMDLLGKVLVLIYGIFSIIVHESYVEQLPMMPVSLGGQVLDDLPFDAGSTCGAAQNTHCSGSVLCTTLTPDELIPDGLVFRDRIYVTTRLDVYTNVLTCKGRITKDLCIGSMVQEDADRLTVYTMGVETLTIQNQHSSKDPFLGGADVHAIHHCSLPGQVAIAPLKGAACADPATVLDFTNQGFGSNGECNEGDTFDLGHFLRAADVGADADDKLLNENGGLKAALRDSGVVVHAKIVYSGYSPDKIKYKYEAAVIGRDAYSTAKTEKTEETEWVMTAAGTYVRNETLQLRQGVIIDFSQEGIVGATNVHALVVSMMALVSLLGLVTKGVTYVAILAPGFKYQQNLFVVKASATTPPAKFGLPGDREVEVWDGHQYNPVVAGDGGGGEGGGGANLEMKVLIVDDDNPRLPVDV